MTYEEWEQTVAKESYQYGIGNSRERCVYEMLGQHIFVETHVPYNWFKSTTQRVVAQNFNIKEDDPIMKLAKKHGALWEEGYYAEEGYGWPFWYDGGDPENDGTKKCFEFITEYNEVEQCTAKS